MGFLSLSNRALLHREIALMTWPLSMTLQVCAKMLLHLWVNNFLDTTLSTYQQSCQFIKCVPPLCEFFTTSQCYSYGHASENSITNICTNGKIDGMMKIKVVKLLQGLAEPDPKHQRVRRTNIS